MVPPSSEKAVLMSAVTGVMGGGRFLMAQNRRCFIPPFSHQSLLSNVSGLFFTDKLISSTGANKLFSILKGK